MKRASLLLCLCSTLAFAQSPTCNKPQVSIFKMAPSICLGSTLQVKGNIAVEDSGSYTFQWFRRNQALGQPENIVLTKTSPFIATYRLNQGAAPYDSGTYRVVVKPTLATSSACTAQDSVKIDVLNPIARIILPVTSGGTFYTSQPQVMLTAQPPQNNEVGIWVLISGQGSIANPASSSALVVGLENVGIMTYVQWIVRDKAALCPPAVANVAIVREIGSITIANAGPDDTIAVGSTPYLLIGNEKMGTETCTWKSLSPLASFQVDPLNCQATFLPTQEGKYVFTYEIHSLLLPEPSRDSVAITVRKPLGWDNASELYDGVQVQASPDQGYHIASTLSTALEAQLLNTQGQTLQHFTILPRQTTSLIPPAAKGIYILRLSNGQRNVARKIAFE